MSLGEGTVEAAESARERVSLLAPVRRLEALLQAEQDRWFLWVPVFFGLGIFTYFRLPSEPHVLLALMLFVAVLVTAAVARRGTFGVIAVNAAIAVSLGFAAAKIRTEWVSAPVLDRQMSRVLVEGFIEAVEPRPTRGPRVTIRVLRLGSLDPTRQPRRVRVRLMSATPGLAPGMRIKVRATLAPPALPSLPGDYDFARAAWFSGIGGVGYAAAKPVISADTREAPWSLRMSASAQRLRHVIGGRITAVLPGEEGAIATALITGERGGISPETTEAFRDSGLVHILSISGLHMVVMAGAVFYSVRLALAAIPSIALRYPIKKWAAAAAILGALGYLFISGTSFPTIRAWITISIAFGAILLDRPALALRNVALAAVALLILIPESLFDAGFQMSFAAVVALISFYEFLRDRAEQFSREPGPLFGPVLRFFLFFGGIILTTVIASLAVAPFSAFHFHTSQQYAVLANLIAVPVCNIIVMPGALATLLLMPFGLEAVPLWVMEQGIKIMVWCAYAVAQLPGAVGRVPTFPELAFGLMLLGGLWLCLWRTRWRLLGLGAVALGLALTPLQPFPDVLVGHNAELVAVRGADRKLTALPAAGAQYELSRWLESDGDARSVREATSLDGFRCDAVGCVTSVKGRTVAISRHPAALADDCRRADVLVIPFPKPRGCEPPGLIIDYYAVRDRGTHAIYIGDDIAVVTVAESRGERPWSQRKERPRRVVNRDTPEQASRLQGFAVSDELLEASRRPRTTIEDEDDAAISPTEDEAEEDDGISRPE